MRLVFAFDLDGTITQRELLPRIARLAGLEKEMEELTRLTLSGSLEFSESFRKRFAMLRHIPLRRIRESVASVPLDPDIEAFISEHRRECVIVTGNLDLWVAPLLKRLGCRYFSSRSRLLDGELFLLSVLDKATAAKQLCNEGKRVIAIGESMNDVPLFRTADMGIAFAGVHAPVPELLRLAAAFAPDGKSLRRLLESLRNGDAAAFHSLHHSLYKEDAACGSG